MKRYELLLRWFEKGTPEHVEVDVMYNISKDYLSKKKTNQCYCMGVVDCINAQIKLEERLGDSMPIIVEVKQSDTVVYDWNSRKRIR